MCARAFTRDALVAWAEAPPRLDSAWLRPAATVLTAAAIVDCGILDRDRQFGAICRRRVAGNRVLAAASAADRDRRSTARMAPRATSTCSRSSWRGSSRNRSPRNDSCRCSGQLTDAGREPRSGRGVCIHSSTALARRAARLAAQRDLCGARRCRCCGARTWRWAIEAWRRAHGAHVREWLAHLGEFEALASLSAYRYEHPDDPFPETRRRRPRPPRCSTA